MGGQPSLGCTYFSTNVLSDIFTLMLVTVRRDKQAIQRSSNMSFVRPDIGPRHN